MKKQKAAWFLLPFLFLASACGESGSDITLSLKDCYQGTYEVGCPIDVENFFYCSKLGVGTTKVTYANAEGENVEETLTGHVYYPAVAGIYTFRFSAEGKSIGKQVEVVDAVPSLSTGSIPYVVTLNEDVFFDEVFAQIHPQYSPSLATLSVTGVEHRSSPVSVGASYGAWEKVETGKDYFTASQMGEYRLLLAVKNGAQTTEGSIRIVVTKKAKDGDGTVLQNEETGKYQSRNLVLGDETGTYRLPAANYSESAYFVLKDSFALGDGVEVRFQGKNLPGIGMYMEGNPLSYSPFDPYSANGYVLSFEAAGTDHYVLYGPEGMSSKAVKVAVSSRGEFWGVQDLDSSKYYSLKCFLAGNACNNGIYTHFLTWTIYEITGFGTANETYNEVKSLNSSGWTDTNSIEKGYFSFYSSKYNDVTFQVRYGLEDLGDGTYLSKGMKVGEDTYHFDKAIYSNDRTNGHSVSSGFLAQQGDYGAGDTVFYSFHGKNIPNVCLFADSLSSMVGGGEGLYLSTGTNDATLLTRMTIYGPHRLDSGSPKDYDTYENIGYNGRLTTQTNSPFGYSNLDDDKDYVYQIQIKEASSDKVAIDLTLYASSEGSSWSQAGTYSFSLTNYDGPTYGSVIAYPSFATAATEGTTFRYYPINENPMK